MDSKEFIASCVAEARVVDRKGLLQIFSDNIQRIKDGDYAYYHKEFFLEREEQKQQELLQDFDNGKPVIFQSDTMHFGYGFWGEDIKVDLFTDGTYKVASYGCS